MSEPARTTLPVLVASIRERLQFVLDFPPERVIPDARDDDDEEFPTKADQYVLMRAGNGTPTGDYLGAGRNALCLRRDITCTLWTRLQADEARSDEQWLLAASIGHLQAEHKLYDALAGFIPADEEGVALVPEPLWPEPVNAPKKSRKRQGWGRSSVRFAVTYTLDIDTTYP